MSSDNHETDVGASATRKRTHATLVEYAEGPLPKNKSIVVGNWLSGVSVERSGLLSGVADTAGLADLPRRLSPEDIKLWETAYIVDLDMRPADLVTVLKVADALGDANSTTWVIKLANMALATFQQPGSSDSDAMLGALLRLAPHLLPRVLSACLCQTTLSEILLTFPAPLHPAITSAAAAGGGLSFSHKVASTILTLLPLLAVPRPGLLKLDIISTPAGDSAFSTGALLARAVSAHPTLTRLSLNAAPLVPQWLRSFSGCLSPGALPRLADLALCVQGNSGGYAEVAACLAFLPSLTSLSISVHLPDTSEAATEPLAAYTQLTAAPASLPHRESLDLQEAAIRHVRIARRTQLGHRLLYDSRQCSRAHSFLSVLTAPALTHLSLALHTARLARGTLLPQLHRFPTLEDVEITAAIQTTEWQFPRRTGTVSAALPALKSIRVDSPCSASRAAVCAAVMELGSSSLTAVNLSLEDSEMGRTHFSLADAHMAWHCFFAVLSERTRVQRLDFQQSLCEVPRISKDDYSRSLSSAVGRLTLLTQLNLVPEPRVSVALNGHDFGRALSKLIALESLTIDRGLGALEFVLLEPVTRACAALTRVTFLRLCFDGLARAHVTDLPLRLVRLRRLEFGEGVFTPSELDAFEARFTSVAVGVG